MCIECGSDIEKCIDDLKGFKIASLGALLCGKLPCQGKCAFILAFICSFVKWKCILRMNCSTIVFMNFLRGIWMEEHPFCC